MTIYFTNPAARQYKKLSADIKDKVTKQLTLLQNDSKHPSLHLKKKVNSPHFELRIDRHYRIAFAWVEDGIHIFAIGPHDEGLGKK
jgi:mRNA-degrading endonuclease RelE of RelBE toxin-antitoxin system